MKFYEQLERHYNSREGVVVCYIKPQDDWELYDYKHLHSYIQQGWLVSDDYFNDYYIINPEWEGEEPWTPPKYIVANKKIIKIPWTEDDFCDRDTCYFCDEENDGDWVDGQEDAVCIKCSKKWRYDDNEDCYKKRFKFIIKS